MNIALSQFSGNGLQPGIELLQLPVLGLQLGFAPPQLLLHTSKLTPGNDTARYSTAALYPHYGTPIVALDFDSPPSAE